MKKISILFLFLMLSTVQGANSASLFAKDFKFSSGAPTEKVCQFDGINGPVTVTVTPEGHGNGDLDRFGSCVIYLNDNVLFDLPNFNQATEKIQKEVTIDSGVNVLRVVMEGKTGESLRVSITQKGGVIEAANPNLNPSPKNAPKGPQGFKITGVTYRTHPD